MIKNFVPIAVNRITRLSSPPPAPQTVPQKALRISPRAHGRGANAVHQHQWRQGNYLDAVGTRLKARDMNKLLNE